MTTILCQHQFEPCPIKDYELCALCGTYHSLTAVDPKALYRNGYWSNGSGHSTIEEQQHNVDVHEENGLTKNDFVLQHIPSCNTVLEIGCAPGNLLKKLRERGTVRIVGIEVDPSYLPEIIKIAGADTIDVLLWGFFPSVTTILRPQCFDAIVALDLFEHIHEPLDFLKECYRLLHPSGTLLLMMPLVSPNLPERFFNPAEHVYIHSHGHMNNLLLESGFRYANYYRWTEGHELIVAMHDRSN